jgi:endonuclease III
MKNLNCSEKELESRLRATGCSRNEAKALISAAKKARADSEDELQPSMASLIDRIKLAAINF